MRSALQVDLPGGPVVFLEATPSELLHAARLAAEPSLASAEPAIAMAGLSLTVRQIFGATVGPMELAAEPLETRVSVREHKALVNAWMGAHFGGPADQEAVGASITEDPLGWRVAIGERRFLLAELPMRGVLAVNRAADKEKTPAGRILAVGMEGIRASLKAIDGEPPGDLSGPDLGGKISARELWTLSALWSRFQGEMAPVGEAKAVAGI